MLAVLLPLLLFALPGPAAGANCIAGQFNSSSTTCASCPAGTYCPFSIGCLSSCIQCPSNSGSMAGKPSALLLPSRCC